MADGNAASGNYEPLMRGIADYFVARSAIVVGDVKLGAGVNLWPGVIIRGDLATITLGPRVNLQDGTIVHTDFGADLTIEEGVVAGHAVVIHGSRVERDCLIGIGSRLLSGTVIGAGSIIAAGAVVTEGKQIPPRSLVMGIPGKVIREVSDQELEKTRRINLHYFEMAQKYARGEFPPPWNSGV